MRFDLDFRSDNRLLIVERAGNYAKDTICCGGKNKGKLLP